MKETPIFEEVFNRLIHQQGFWMNFFIGGLLSFVPGLNIFAFGYLLRLSRSIRQTGQVALPAWSDWSGLFEDGLKFGVVWLLYWFLPVLFVGSFCYGIFHLGLGAFSYLLFMLIFLLSPILFSSALYRFTMNSDFKDLLDVVLIIRMTAMELRSLLIPAIVFVGLFTLALPLYGFPIFFGFTLLVTFSSLRYRSIEQKGSSSY